VKEVCRLIRAARSEWDAHNNASCRRLRGQAMRAYLGLTDEEKKAVPQVLRVWLRYRSERYFGARPGPRRSKRRGGRAE
jgi:hypothetical protein